MKARDATLTAVMCASLVVLMFSSAICATPKFPALTGRVVDDANILSPATRDDLTAMLARHEQATGQQVVVVTLASLQGYSIEDFGYQLGRYWGIGQKGKNTGTLLMVAPKDRKVRIEVGYGLEGKLTDAQSRIIIEQQILPAFRLDDYNAGVIAGTAAVLKALGGSGVSETARTAPSQPIEDSPWVIPLLLGGWGLFLLLRRAMAGPAGARGIRRSRGPVFFPGGPYPPGGGFPGGGWGGGGGFSGGGGSFGGGGASGSW